ncbi:MAG: carbohydrate kinase family protein [Victivallales bacterium]
MKTKSKINCIGILVADALSGPLEHYPERKIRSQAITKTIRFAAGGGAANTGGALAKMGLDTGVFSKVGDDLTGDFILRELSGCGVEVSGVKVSKGENTPFTFVGVHPDGDRTFIHTPGTNLTFKLADIDTEKLFSADYLLYQDCWVLPKLDGAPAAKLLAKARRRGVVTLLDECWGLGPRLDVLKEMLPHCDYFMPSCDDVASILPGLSPGQIADKLLSMGAKNVMLKMGAEGCLLCFDGKKIKSPSMAGRIVDTTGAGDCWDAGFIAGLANGLSIEDAARTGSAAASMCMEHVGGCAGIPSCNKILDKIGRIK